MEELLNQLATEQHDHENTGTVTLALSTGGYVVGIVEGVLDGVVSIRREIEHEVFADIPRHYALAAVVGAYYTEWS